MSHKWGVIEGFFGPDWPETTRRFYAEQMRDWGGSFYYYAPKRDARLRKNWRATWSAETIKEYSNRTKVFQSQGVRIAFGLSPFELKPRLSLNDREALHQRASQLSDLGVDELGLFFDDMKAYDGLAESQLEALYQIQTRFHQGILFCPSYYSDDPILDKVFGARPKDYEVTLANELPAEVGVVWTGPKVISPQITVEHLNEVNKRWKRKVFLWENLYANDGPKRCELIPFEEYTGRPLELEKYVTGVGFNPMNEGHLASLMVRHAVSLPTGRKTTLPDQLTEMTPELESIWRKDLSRFRQGRSAFSDQEKADLMRSLAKISSPYARELVDFLAGEYVVGPECLTD